MRTMSVKERNKLIKKVLSQEFGYNNVRVKGDRGTAYGWVNVHITVKKPHKGECEDKGWLNMCDECRELYYSTKRRVWEILEKADLVKELGIYYDDFGNKHHEIIIDIDLKDDVKTPEKREKDIIEGNGYTVEYEGSWTWVKFSSKPPEDVREKLKNMGFRFSRKRLAWYLPRKIEVVI